MYLTFLEFFRTLLYCIVTLLLWHLFVIFILYVIYFTDLEKLIQQVSQNKFNLT